MEEGADVGLFRLPVDRVFTMKGFGTVVTGTLVSGKVATGEEVEISPVGLRARVRGIQVHNRTVETAEAGQRTAINLQGIDREAIERGYVLTGPGALTASQRLDCIYRHLTGAGRKLKNRTLVRLHTGTSEIMARMILLDRDELEPGEEGCAQLVLETPLAVVAGDRFVVRSYSPVTTIGGGVIVDPLPAKHKRSSAGVLQEFQRLAGGGDEERMAVILERAGIGGITENLPDRPDRHPRPGTAATPGGDVFREERPSSSTGTRCGFSPIRFMRPSRRRSSGSFGGTMNGIR